MCAYDLMCGQVSATPSAQVDPSADWMLVIRKMYRGFGTALSKRKSVQPSTKMVRSYSSSATGPSAGVLPLEVMPMNMSIFSESLSRRISLVLASVPAASSALRISIFLFPSSPPCALISSAASWLPLYIGSPSTAPAPVSIFNLVAPVAILSLARRRPDFITWNPWLSRLPDYLASDEPLGKKLSFVSNMAIAWVSADNGGEGIDWGFIIDMPTIFQIVATSLIFGTYFALWSYRREAFGLPAGVAGACTSVVGLTTGPCTLAGCGVPVLPVVGLALTRLSTRTLTLPTTLSRIRILVIPAALGAAVHWL